MRSYVGGTRPQRISSTKYYERERAKKITKRNWTKRILPILLAAALLFSIIPVSAAPQDETTTMQEETTMLQEETTASQEETTAAQEETTTSQEETEPVPTNETEVWIENEPLSVSSTTWDADSYADTSSPFTVICSTSWTATSNQSWLSISVTDNTTFTISAAENAIPSERMGAVTVRTDSGTSIGTIAVTQAGAEPTALTPEAAMIYESAAIGMAHYASTLNNMEFKYDPSINYGEMLEDDSLQFQFANYVASYDLSNLQNLSDLLETAGYSNADVALFVERWAVAFARMDLWDVWQVINSSGADLNTEMIFVPLLGQEPLADVGGMLSIVFNYYYESIFTGFFEFISDTLSQETFGVDYKEALILYYETQAWSAFQETLVEHHILVSYSYKWAVASYLKNLAAMNGIFDEIELAQEAMGIGWFELMTSSYGATFKHDPNKTYSDFGAAMTETAGIGSDFLSAVLGAGLGDADSLRTALVSEGFTNVEATAFIGRMAEVFTYQSLQSLKDTFTELLDEGTPDSLISMLTTPALAEDIEDMVGVMIAHNFNVLGTILSNVEISEDIATPVMLWLYAAYMQSFSAINDIAVEPGSIPPDDYPIKNYTAKEELTRAGITVAFAEAQGIDVELVEVDETTMQALLEVILARDLADLGLMFNGTLLHKGTTASDFLLFSMLCLLFGSENEEFDVFSIVSVLQTTASFPFDDLFTELDSLFSRIEFFQKIPHKGRAVHGLRHINFLHSVQSVRLVGVNFIWIHNAGQSVFAFP